MYALNLSEDGRILSACAVLPNRKYDGMPIMEDLPDGNLCGYRYVNGTFHHDPITESEQVETPETEEKVDIEKTIAALETDITEMKEALEMILSGVTE